MRVFLFISMLNLVLADPPNWIDDPGAYQFTAVMNVQILTEGMSIADCVGGDTNGDNICDDIDGDMLAAFDVDGNVRGIGIPILVSFGPYEGQVIYEAMLRSNSNGDVLTFKYYDGSEDSIYELEGAYNFNNNDLLGTLIDPYTLSCISCVHMDINDSLVPLRHMLGQNYPNPYNPRTFINYTIAELSNVTLSIYDIKGQLITELISKMHQSGKYKTVWNSGNLSSGMYFLEMKVYSRNDQLMFKDINKILYLK